MIKKGMYIAVSVGPWKVPSKPNNKHLPHKTAGPCNYCPVGRGVETMQRCP